MNEFPWKSQATIIGGYSILGYGTLRYSMDLDLVIPKESSDEIIRWFTAKGFLVEKTAHPNPQNYDGAYVRYRKEEVTIDLLIGAVRDRDAQVDIPAKWICKRPKMQRIEGLNHSTERKVPLVRLEALWALKLQAGRYQDISDLYSIFKMKFDKNEVIELFKSLGCKSLSEKLIAVKTKLNDSGTYPDIRSRLNFKDSEKNGLEWKRFTFTVAQIIDKSCS